MHRLILGLRSVLPAVLLFAAGVAAPQTQTFRIDFSRDVPSRQLQGLATQSDGRLVPGPVLRDLTGQAPATLLWCLEPGATAAQWFAGTGPDGRIVELTIDPTAGSYTSREVARLDDTHVFKLRRLADGALLAGTSPGGRLCLVREGQLVARADLPVDSIFDLLLLPDGRVLVATGNPGRIYRLDLAAFAAAGIARDKLTAAPQLAAHGLTLFGEVRDRNLRRLARLADGRIVAGSAPKGNLYAFAATGGAPVFLQENKDAEVTDLLPRPEGGFYATLVQAGGAAGEARIQRSQSAAPTGPTAPAAPGGGNRPPEPVGGTAEPPAEATAPAALSFAAPERFAGRSQLLWFPPAGGFPETCLNRGQLAFYRVVALGDRLLIAGGEQGDVLGYDPVARLALTFAGSTAAQLNDLAPIPGASGRFLVLKNNAPGLALLDFGATGPRAATTRRLDLGTPTTLGALRFGRVLGLAPADCQLELRTNLGADELEGWTDWTPLAPSDTPVGANDGWAPAPSPRGRYAQLRLHLPVALPPTAALDAATWYHLPQNRRPQLREFHVLPPNCGLQPAPEPVSPPGIPLSQMLNTDAGEESRAAGKAKAALLNSFVVPEPGTQIVVWSITDPDNDDYAVTFSLRRAGDADWTDLAVHSRESYATFATTHFPDGVYGTRLIASELAPRPPAERLSVTFETDDLVIDHTPPVLLAATAVREAGQLVLTVRGRDALSLLAGLEASFNNGVKETVEQPADGLRDSREETFSLTVPLARIADATQVELALYDEAGNRVTRRLGW